MKRMMIMSVQIGEAVPDIALENQDGHKVSLADYKGQKIVLYFYPKDMTPGCTTEACNFRDQHEAYEDLGAVVIGVSPDPIEKHKKFIDKHDLPFTLLADTDHRLAEAYGVWKLKKMFGKEFHGIERSTFVIDEAGKLLKAFRKVKVKGHADEILDLLKGA